MNRWPRVAFFSDSYHGVDGVATTCRNIVGAARKQGLPFLAVHVGENLRYAADGLLEILELDQSPASLPIDKHLKFDLLFPRHYRKALAAVKNFRADLVHITGPSDVGITGARVAHALKLPLVASWHTNLHEFAARRLYNLSELLPGKHRRALADLTEENVLRACVRFYQLAKVVLAPNREQVNFLHYRTRKPVFPMRRGIDTQLFSPAKRDACDRVFRLGFVGRLCPEKNVRFLVKLERDLAQNGIHNYRFLVVGDGGERPWLERNLPHADFTGELHGELLARAYANMDIFVFPSETDTFGNVISEAMASGTPVVVTSKGGPKYQVQQGTTGFVATDENDFLCKVKWVIKNPDEHRRFRESCRSWAIGRSWSGVLDDLLDAYHAGLSWPVAQHITQPVQAAS